MRLKKCIVVFLSMGLPATLNADVIDSMLLMKSIVFRNPILVDTIDVNGERHDISKILMNNYISPYDYSENDSYNIKSDTSGLFKLPLQESDSYAMYVLNTRMRSDIFSKIKLEFTTPVVMKLYINGSLVSEKKKRNESMSDADVCTADISMEPGKIYEVSLRLLVEPKDLEYIPLKAQYKNQTKNILNAVAYGPGLKGRYLLDNTVLGVRPTRVSVSPNGKYVLVGYTERFDKNRTNVYTVLSEIETGKELATFTHGSKYMDWTPLTSQLYYTDISDTGIKVITIDPKTMKKKTFIDGLPDSRFRWSPDEKSLYFSSYETIKMDEKPVKRLLSTSDRVPGSRNRWYIQRYDIEKGINERLTAGLHTSSLQDISNDGRYIMFSVYESVPDKWPFGKSSLYMLDVNSMRLDTLVSEDPFINSARFSPDSDKVIIMGGPESFNGIGKNCGKYPIANNYDNQAFIMDLKTRNIDAITRDFAPSVSFLQWNEVDGCIYFKVSEGIREPIYSYNCKNRTFNRLNLYGDCIWSFSLSTKSNKAAYTSVTAESSAAAYVHDVKKNKSILFDDPYAESIKELEMGKIKEWNFLSSDGTKIEGYYCLPPNFDASHKYPLIVYYYGGTTPTTLSMDSPYSAQLFASRGYVVYVINPSGTIGYGQEFSARHVNAWGQRTADDIIEGVLEFCKEHSFINTAKIGCIGASYGGFMTQYLQTRTDIFAAAVSHAGISNLASYWGEGYWGVGYNAVAAAKSYPWNNPDLFVRQGSLFNADRIKTPLLLLHGKSDTNVPIGESIQLYNALKILGREVEFIQVDGEDHFISDYSKREMWHNSIMAWFAKWLQDSSEWWDDIYPQSEF